MKPFLKWEVDMLGDLKGLYIMQGVDFNFQIQKAYLYKKHFNIDSKRNYTFRKHKAYLKLKRVTFSNSRNYIKVDG